MFENILTLTLTLIEFFNFFFKSESVFIKLEIVTPLVSFTKITFLFLFKVTDNAYVTFSKTF